MMLSYLRFAWCDVCFWLQVSTWVTHLIITQPTHEDRKAVLSCILRVALSCWNIGNFNGAMEIVAGLK